MDRRVLLISIASLLGACSQHDKASADSAADSLRLSLLVLLLPEFVFEKHLPEPDLLSNYVKALINAASGAMTSQPKDDGFSGQIVALFKPGGRARYWLMSKSPDKLARHEASILKALKDVKVPPVEGGALAFAALFDVGEGGPNYVNDGMVIPDEWVKAFPPGGGILDEKLLMKVWPD